MRGRIRNLGGESVTDLGYHRLRQLSTKFFLNSSKPKPLLSVVHKPEIWPLFSYDFVFFFDLVINVWPAAQSFPLAGRLHCFRTRAHVVTSFVRQRMMFSIDQSCCTNVIMNNQCSYCI